MEFDTFYQYFLYSKSRAYLCMFVILPLFVLFWNTVLFPTKDKDVLKIWGWIKSKAACLCPCKLFCRKAGK